MSEKNEAIEVELAVRGRLMADRDPSERRMDTLARLLAGRSACVSASLINDTLFITANEFSQSTQVERNESYKSITEIMGYFCGITMQDAEPENRQKLFKKICAEQLKGLGKNAPIIPVEFPDKIIEIVLQNRDPKVSEFISDYGINAKLAGFLYGEFRNLYRDFLKLEESIKAKRIPSDDRSDGITNEQFNALNNNSFEILLEEPKKKKKKKKETGKKDAKKEPKGTVHAEVQVLSHIVRMINHKELTGPKELYIGISKLCCLNCRVMLEKANDIFEKEDLKINLKVRGRHDLDFGKKWMPPALFSTGYNSDFEFENSASLEDKIGYSTKVNILELTDLASPAGVAMVAALSSSEDDAVLERNIENRKESLVQQLSFLQQLQQQDENITIKTTFEMMILAIQLHEMPLYIDLYRREFRKQEGGEIDEDFYSLLKYLQKKDNTITPEILLNVLKSPIFVGNEISRYFEGFNIELQHEVGDGLASFVVQGPAVAEITNPLMQKELGRGMGMPVTPLKNMMETRQQEFSQTAFVDQEASSSLAPPSKKIKNDSE